MVAIECVILYIEKVLHWKYCTAECNIALKVERYRIVVLLKGLI